MAEPLTKTGRGGAGNYWSRKDLEEAAKAGPDEVRPQLSHLCLSRFHQATVTYARWILYQTQVLMRNQDIEAQKADPSLLNRTTLGHLTLTDYSKIGRGGAGNIVYTSESSASTSELERVTTARAINNAIGSAREGPQVYQKHSGRGGAGNWRGNFEEEKRKREEEEEGVRREVERRVNEEVGMSLKPPGAAYRGP